MKALYLGFLSLVLSLSIYAAETGYSEHIQPIFTEKCVACHACYDSPCQLNLGSGEGLVRGAHKQPIYNGGRLRLSKPLDCLLMHDRLSSGAKKAFLMCLTRVSHRLLYWRRCLSWEKRSPLPPIAAYLMI